MINNRYYARYNALLGPGEWRHLEMMHDNQQSSINLMTMPHFETLNENYFLLLFVSMLNPSKIDENSSITF